MVGTNAFNPVSSVSVFVMRMVLFIFSSPFLSLSLLFPVHSPQSHFWLLETIIMLFAFVNKEKESLEGWDGKDGMD
jgi:hypothetical protein